MINSIKGFCEVEIDKIYLNPLVKHFTDLLLDL